MKPASILGLLSCELEAATCVMELRRKGFQALLIERLPAEECSMHMLLEEPALLEHNGSSLAILCTLKFKSERTELF